MPVELSRASFMSYTGLRPTGDESMATGVETKTQTALDLRDLDCGNLAASAHGQTGTSSFLCGVLCPGNHPCRLRAGVLHH
jgi:hypothetical protein